MRFIRQINTNVEQTENYSLVKTPIVHVSVYKYIQVVPPLNRAIAATINLI